MNGMAKANKMYERKRVIFCQNRNELFANQFMSELEGFIFIVEKFYDFFVLFLKKLCLFSERKQFLFAI